MDFTYATETWLILPAAQIYEINGKYQKLLQQGDLAILHISQHDLTFLKLNGFQYPLQKSVPVMTQQVKNEKNTLPLKMYVFPGIDQFYYGIIIDQTQKDICDVFENILSNKCQLVQPNENVIRIFCLYLKQFQFFVSQGGQLQKKQSLKELSSQQSLSQEQLMKNSQVQLVQPQKLNLWNNVGAGQKSTASDFIVQTGEYLKEGIVYGATQLAKGIKAGGEYIQGKISDKEEKQIDPSTINKVKMANVGSKAMVVYTKVQVEALMAMGKTVAAEAAKQFESSETGQKLQKNEDYEDAKNIGKATLYAFVSVYDGLYTALAQLGTATAEATTAIVNTKYGNQAGELSKESFEVVGNVGQITRAYKDAAAKVVIEETKPQQKK